MSRVELSLPFSSISSDHVVRIAFDTWEIDDGDKRAPFFIAFIMTSDISRKLDKYLSLAIWEFLDDFKSQKENYNLRPAWNKVNQFLKKVSTREVESLKEYALSHYKVVLAGLTFAGKTSILNRIIKGIFLNPEPTPGFTTEIIQQGSARFQMMDLGGQDAFIQTLWRPLLAQTDALVYIVDASDLEKLMKARDILNTAMMWGRDIKILLILANKNDLPGSLGRDDILERMDLSRLIKQFDIQKFFIASTSAKTGEGIDEAFTWLAKQLTKQDQIPIIKIQAVSIFKREIHKRKVKNLGQVTFRSKGGQFLESTAYSVVKDFLEGSLGDRIIKVEIESFDGYKYRIDSIERRDLCCLLLSNFDADNKIIRAIGNEILDYTTKQLKFELPLNKLEIREIVSPFIEQEPVILDQEGKIILQEKYDEILVNGTNNDKVMINGWSEQKKEINDFFSKLNVLENVRVLSEEENDWKKFLSEEKMINILYVDDLEDWLILGKKFLEKRIPGTNVIPINSPVQALKELDKHEKDINIIIADYLMPEMTGIEFLRRVREKNSEIPFIILTIRSSDDLDHLCNYFGATGYILKKKNAEKSFAEVKNIINKIIENKKWTPIINE
ncbi:MAG: ADP-ribosylation factor-like protein [Candidatus Hodarchaeales archaeon]